MLVISSYSSSLHVNLMPVRILMQLSCFFMNGIGFKDWLQAKHHLIRFFFLSFDLELCHQMRFEFSRDSIFNPWSGEIQLVPEREECCSTARAGGAFLCVT